MRKIIAIILAVVMIAAMSVTVFAKNLADAPEGANTGTVPVTYESSKGYQVVIPEAIALNDEGTNGDTTSGDSVAGGTAVITIEKAKLNSGETLSVSVKSQNAWFLQDSDEADDISYSAVVKNTKNNGNINDLSITSNDDANIVIKYTSNATNITEDNKPTSTMIFTTALSNQAGNFSDNLTFTASVA